ncbi:degenerin mec-4-like [Amphibalanus amphitrite]|uniref:degenerin mec-4-like n=1 Tax=Amphibalanus amphitrite TaxID=1232801 RepID=UPI001C9060C3|nr:degenerin mec-4-like [Amphibalanus amphitrite]
MAARGGRPTSLGAVISEVSDHAWSATGIGGLSHAHGARLPLMRLLWLVLFLVGLALTAIDVRRVVLEYLSSPHVTKTDTKYETTVPFPSVTVCNQNQVDCLLLLKHSMDPRYTAVLSRVLILSDCLEEDALSCPLVWDTVASSANEQLIDDTEPFCLGCGRCKGLRDHIAKEQEFNRSVESITALYRHMGCQSTCLADSADEEPDEDDGRGSERNQPPDVMATATGGTDTAGGGDRVAGTNSSTNEDSTTEDGISGRNGTMSGNTRTEDGAISGNGTLAGSTPDAIIRTARVKRKASPDDGGPSGGDWQSSIDASSVLTPSQTHDAYMEFLFEYLSLPEELRAAVGVQFSDLVGACVYSGTDCKQARFFWRYTTPEYGNCYTFNTDIVSTADFQAGTRSTSFTGDKHGLVMILNTVPDRYPPAHTAAWGARVVIHPSDQLPAVGSAGLSLPPQTTTALALRQANEQRLRSPYSANCISEWNETDIYPKLQRDNEALAVNRIAYSKEVCELLCSQSQFMRLCGCTHPLLPTYFGNRTESEQPLPHLPPCQMFTNGNHSECVDDVQDQLNRQELTCKCPLACQDTSYDILSSSARWPQNLVNAAGRMGLSGDILTTAQMNELEEEILELKVYFRTLLTENIEQEGEFTGEALLSTLGGAMSLYLGISLVMLAEFLQYIILLLWAVLRYFAGKFNGDATREKSQWATPPPSVGVTKVVITRPVGLKHPYLSGAPTNGGSAAHRRSNY